MSKPAPAPIAYSLKDAARVAAVSQATLKQAIHATDPNAYPPPLPAFRLGTHDRARYRVRRDALEAWVDRLAQIASA